MTLSGAKRLLVVLALLVGVTLMHGIAAGHLMPHTGAMASASGPTLSIDRPSMSTSADFDQIETAQQIVESSGHGAPECLAVLGGLLVLILACGRYVKRSRLRPRSGLGHQRTPGANAGAALWVTTPSLARLCITRT